MPLTRGGFRHYDYDRMVVWKWLAQFSSPATTWMDQLEGIHHHIAGAYLLRYAQERSWRGTTAVCRTASKSTASQALSLKRGESVDFGRHWQRHSKDVHA